MSDIALTNAFRTLAQQPPPPKLLQSLSYSERRMFDKSLVMYAVLPESASEIRAAFHCTMTSAAKVYAALAGYFCPVKSRKRIRK